MARIFYSMAGEGRGHAARVRTLVELLRHDHELVLFAPDEAYDFLAACYGGEKSVPNVTLLRIPGIRFHYTSRRLDLTKTIASGLTYAWRDLPKLVRAFRRRIAAERPDLVIADFEPALPRAAAREGVPVLSLDHQHVLLCYDLSTLPMDLRRYAWAMSWAVRLYYPVQREIAVSSFYSPPLKPGWEMVHQIGPMIRADIAQARPSDGEHLLSYLRANTPEHVLDAFAQVNQPVKIYGLGERPSRGPLTFCPIHEQRFVDDLASCRAVVCAAGNQLLGESLFLGKPVLAVPERLHHEQCINAHFLRQMGVGDFTSLESLKSERIVQFLQEAEGYRRRLKDLSGMFNGTSDAVAVIQSMLSRTTPKFAESVLA